jgi:hypothetical protein
MMTPTEVERLLNADLEYRPDVHQRYGPASQARMAALEAQLRKVVAAKTALATQ